MYNIQENDTRAYKNVLIFSANYSKYYGIILGWSIYLHLKFQQKDVGNKTGCLSLSLHDV